MRIDPNKNPIYIVLFATLISALFTAAIMALHVGTQPLVEANERALTEKAIIEVFGLGNAESMTAEQAADLIRRRVVGLEEGEHIILTDEATGESIRILAAFKEDIPADAEPDIHDHDAVLGYALRLRGVGFWAVIEGWLAVQPGGDKALGVVFTRHQETPGLGGRITEAEFRDQFKGLDVSPPKEGPYVYIDRTAPEPGNPELGRHVDSITGATGTSTAVDKFLNEDLARFRRIATAQGLLPPQAGQSQEGE